MPLKQNRISHIDAWRLIAVTMVVISHILKFSSPWYRDNLPWMIISRSQGLGNFGVKIFFCISGFVICRGLLAEQKEHGTISIKAFYLRRFLRILPPLLLYMAGLALLTYIGIINVQPSQFTYAGLFLCNAYLDRCGWLLAHTWSLAYEEQFYLFFPVIFIASTVFGGRKTVLALTLAMMFAAFLAIYLHLESIAFALGTFICMLMGCVAAMYWHEIEPRLARFSARSWMVLVTVSVTIGCLVIWPDAIALAINAFLLPVLLCAMVLSTPVASPRIAAFFLNPKAIYLGKISFTIYLWQQLATANEFIQRPWLNFVALAATVLIGMVSYRYLERPAIRLGASLSARISTRRKTVLANYDTNVT